jgi:hypothetical protein
LYSSHLQARKRQEEEEEVRQLERREEEQEFLSLAGIKFTISMDIGTDCILPF